MTEKTNPHVNAGRRSKSALGYSFLRYGTVSTAKSASTGAEHSVTVQEEGVPADRRIPVVPTVHGDFYVPPESAPVLVAPFGQNDYAVVGAPVPATDIPQIEPGERIISHPLSSANVKFNKDGSIDISGDAEVRINGGEQGAITDVEAVTETDADGHVTSVSLNITREDSIKI